MSGSYSLEDVRKHNTNESAWIVIDHDVYDISKFAAMHPGGSAIILQFAGQDATEAFFDMHRIEVLKKYQRFKIGSIAGAPKQRALDQCMTAGQLSMVPYAEHNSLQGWLSPILKPEHKLARQAVKKWYDDNNVRETAVRVGAANKLPPKELYKKMGKAGLLAGHLAPHPAINRVCEQYNIPNPCGVSWDKFDLHMEQIVHEEHTRIGVPGFVDGLTGGFDIACPCIIEYGTDEMKEKVLPQLLLGEKRICLAISEPFAGSDVANIKTTATKTADGKHFQVTGIKKWITGGLDSDYFVTAVRTGGKGMGGISLLLVERGPGLDTTLIKTSYSASAGTAYVNMDKVLVPVQNILGQENKGFNCIMNNFNHERWMIVVNLLASCRLVIADSLLWANQRKVFGKPLMNQPIIQSKISEMAAQVEALSNWLDLVTYQMQNLPHNEQGKKLAGPIALLKFYSTRVSLLCADHASQVFGGRAITRTGMGQNVERFARAVKYAAIYGGSEEIMVSLAAKQMLKKMPKNARL
mmetsp:Transcript_16523/g.23184  ORF Transcript_16523/g.23184 Transcript_16523/m.23184 type:complete len:524 (-) Transcript_16523:69-1640(-)|eukprot:CAMPEP_0175087988 /NCGR_PEP_ID=MMETSP0086_2-20121207/12_1 /TAXON_ID=136419 /ORGANISM="Unknown Unknown, Strain D1" /LENGTH=523 /DNA_ID=CAMNT_0016360399 /DNA_START=42 /DNA_END=1613 /DNA_ORIENTATION=+